MEATKPRIPIPHDALRAFCERWGVAELALFGSVLRNDFGPESDIDVLVTFSPDVHRTYEDIFDMKTELADLFGRPIDLAQRSVVLADPNWLRRRKITDTARTIYAA